MTAKRPAPQKAKSKKAGANQAPAWLVKAVIHFKSNEPMESLSWLESQHRDGKVGGTSWSDCVVNVARQILSTNPKAALILLEAILIDDDCPMDAWLLAGMLQDKLGQRDAARLSMKTVVVSNHAAPQLKLQAANLLVRLGDQELALKSAIHAFDTMGRPLEHAPTLLYIAQVMADWALIDRLTTQLKAGYAAGANRQLNESPRTHLLWCDDEATNIAVLKQWSEKTLAKPTSKLPAIEPLQGRRLRVGYLSSDFREHPTSRLIMGVLRHHDRQKIELFMYCSGWDDSSALRKDVERQFEHIHSVSELSDADAAKLMRAHKIDVLVELNGPTRANRMGILSYRPAPIQIDYLGWPGSVGGRVVDYIVGDSYTVPHGAEELYPENIIRLHPTYQSNDHAAQSLPDKPTRKQVGLPEDPSLVILGMFNAVNKVHQKVWDTWMQIMQQCPKTLLWILDPGPVARKAIAAAAQKSGVAISRIIASPKLPQDVHLARLQCCDLMLDPWPYGGHTSTSDALFSGVPVLALEGQNFASRVSPSLLKAAELDELICTTPEDYVACAVELLNDPNRLKDIQACLRRASGRGPLFDSEARAKQLEHAFQTAVESKSAGMPLADIAAGSLVEKTTYEKPAPLAAPGERPALVLVCGPWGSGSSAVAGLLAKLGLQAPGPYVKVNDTRTTTTFEMRGFQKVLQGLASEKTLKRKVGPEVALRRLQEFRDDILKPALAKSDDASPIVLKHGLATLFLKELGELFDLRIVGVLRSLDDIEASRLRRNWTANLGKQGATVLYRLLFDHLVSSDVPVSLVRYSELMANPTAELEKLSSFCKITPSVDQTKAALEFVSPSAPFLSNSAKPVEPKERTEADVQFTILKKVPEPKDDEVTVFGVLKNEIYFLPHFLEHYRALGVGRFLFFDDKSNDGSREYLLSQPDCGLLEGNFEFKQLVDGKPFGTRLKQFVPERFLKDRWVLTADLDEFLILPSKFTSVVDFCRALDADGLNHARGLMLDFFPKKLSDLKDTTLLDSPFDISPYFDRLTVFDWPAGRQLPDRISFQDTIRTRMMLAMRGKRSVPAAWEDGYKPASPNKVPLVKWNSRTKLLSAHRFDMPISDANQVVLAHFKFHPNWKGMLAQAIETEAHYNASIEYKMLYEASQTLANHELLGHVTERFRSKEQLVDLGLLFANERPKETAETKSSGSGLEDISAGSR